MSTRVLQWPIKVPIGEIGGSPVMPSYDFLRYLETQRERTGGNQALTNTELETLSDGKYLGVFSSRPSQQVIVKQGDGVTVTQDITGYTVEINMDQIIGAVRAFIPRQESAKEAENDASSVLLTRIFRA